MIYALGIAFGVACCVVSVFLPRLSEWVRQWLILQKLPGPKGGLMGHLKYFNNPYVGQHKYVLRWAREHGGIFRVRLGNVNVRQLLQFLDYLAITDQHDTIQCPS